MEVSRAAQIVGGFGATAQDNSQRRDNFSKLLIYLPGDGRPCPREGTSREENRITAITHLIAGEETRHTEGFIAEQRSVGLGIKGTGCHVIATDFQKKGRRIDAFKTHCGTESAKAALMSDLAKLQSIAGK